MFCLSSTKYYKIEYRDHGKRMSRVVKDKTKNTRSRSGCTNCKKRKKKCDEIKPICTGCYKRNLECKYFLIGGPEDEEQEMGTTLTHVSCTSVFGDNYMQIIEPWVSSELSYMFPVNIEANVEDFLPRLDLDVDLSLDTDMMIKLPTPITKKQYQYLEYFFSDLLPDLSLLPQESNYYSNIYLRMALTEKAALYCIICWGCRAKKGHSIDYQTRNEEYDSLVSVIREELTQMQSDLTKRNFFACFVCYMILVTMEISFGDTKMWSRYFNACFHMANKMPGCLKYLETECYTEGWVLSQNFAYFDILASQTNENGTFYPITDYVNLFSIEAPNSMSDPMQGCIRPLILLIGKTVSLLVEYNALKISADYPGCDRYSVVSEMLEKANNLDNEISFCKPDLASLKYLATKCELEYHLTLFEAFQIAAQLYLRQVIKNLPAVVPEVELLTMNLKQDINVLIEARHFKKSLAFPMLLLGLCVSSPDDRAEVKRFFEELIKLCGYLSSYQSIWVVIQRAWELNNNGQVYVDWFKISKQLEWKLNLAR